MFPLGLIAGTVVGVGLVAIVVVGMMLRR